jgi:hypothetical protein
VLIDANGAIPENFSFLELGLGFRAHDETPILAESGVHVLYAGGAGGETRRDLAGGSVKLEWTLQADLQASKGGRKTCGEMVFAGSACRVMSVIGALR